MRVAELTFTLYVAFTIATFPLLALRIRYTHAVVLVVQAWPFSRVPLWPCPVPASTLGTSAGSAPGTAREVGHNPVSTLLDPKSCSSAFLEKV